MYPKACIQIAALLFKVVVFFLPKAQFLNFLLVKSFHHQKNYTILRERVKETRSPVGVLGGPSELKESFDIYAHFGTDAHCHQQERERLLKSLQDCRS